MTESEWLACTNPTRMLGFLKHNLSQRKQRLFAVACCRRIWSIFLSDLFQFHESCEAVEAAERYAEGMAREKELAGYYHAASMTLGECVRRFRSDPAHEAISAARTAANAAEQRLLWEWQNLAEPEFDPARAAAAAVAAQARRLRPRPEEGARAAGLAELQEQEFQCDILRDLAGNPFRQVIIDPAWLAWNGGTIRALAQVVYEGQAFDRLPILADALEDAGCTDALLILEHLRQSVVHVRGCHLIDLLLRKT
jgi:hypothetical protein